MRALYATPLKTEFMKDNVLKITGIKQLKALFYFIVTIIMYIGVILYFNINDSFFILAVMIPILSFQLLPTVFFHIEYNLKNRGEVYELQGDRIIQYKEGIEMIYTKEDIKKIIIYMSPNYYRGGGYLTGFENYHYAQIILNSGESLYLTSLLAPGGIDRMFDVYLKEIPYLRKKRLFATMLY